MHIEVSIEFDLGPVVDWIESVADEVGREITRVLNGILTGESDAIETPYNEFGELRAPIESLRSDN